ncbi:hypothetical protein Syun_016579 [Stephania yunnanensis]|uniref:EF-hand domain-containing protein n=1 Tax=Stephania yunnanensis TaxID=152371 RepID=A0AAP0J537_9MAGN
MASYNSYTPHTSHNYQPSAPAMPENYAPDPPTSSNSSSHELYGSHGYSQSTNQGVQSNYGYSSSYGYPPVGGQSGGFPPGTHPEIVRSFQMVDKDRSGFIEERELQEALSMKYQKFSLRTVRLIMFLFKKGDSLKIGPNEFTALWNCLGEWRNYVDNVNYEKCYVEMLGQTSKVNGMNCSVRSNGREFDRKLPIVAIFERFDKDRSGKIDLTELRDALYSLGYAVPPSVLQVLMSKYGNGSGRRVELNFDSFVECGMIVKGLTEKFKEKDKRYTGSATLTYDEFLRMIIPFLIP